MKCARAHLCHAGWKFQLSDLSSFAAEVNEFKELLHLCSGRRVSLPFKTDSLGSVEAEANPKSKQTSFEGSASQETHSPQPESVEANMNAEVFREKLQSSPILAVLALATRKRTRKNRR